MKLTCSKCRHPIDIAPEVLRSETPRVACGHCGARFRLKSRPGGPATRQVKTISDLRSSTTPSLPVPPPVAPVPPAPPATGSPNPPMAVTSQAVPGPPPASPPPIAPPAEPAPPGSAPAANPALGATTPLPPAVPGPPVPAGPPTVRSQPTPVDDFEDGPTMISTGGHGRSSASEPIFRAGDVLAERYRIARFIAQGGMGEVYEAEDIELRQAVALKTVSASIGDEPAAVERFKREIALARRVTHANVCRIFDLGQHLSPGASEPVTFLSMELLRGETLSACLRRRGRLSVAEALPLVQQMAAALDAAHQAHVVHRDFKSENVFLVPREGEELHDLSRARAVVTDFGIARGSDATDQFAAQVTGLGIVGTPAYMAPEQVENAPEITHAADIYALGIVIYEMVTGKLPFDGGNPLTTAVKRLQEAPPPPHVHVPDLPAWWERTILRCLERRPKDRFAQVSEIAGALEPPARPTRAAVPSRTTEPEAGPKATAAPAAATAKIPSAAPSALAPAAMRTAAAGPEQPRGEKAEPAGRRTRMLAAILLVVALVSGFLAWQNRDDELDPSRVQLRRSVAVVGFENLSGREDAEWLATALGEMIGAELSQADSLRTVGSERVAATRRQLGPEWRPSELGAPVLERIRALLDCDFIIAGSYVSLDEGGLRLDVRLHDAALGQLVGTFSEQGSSDELFAMVDRLGDQLGEALGAGAGDGELAGLPRDAEAARLYAEGLEHLRAFEPDEARLVLDRALIREPENPLLHSALAAAWDALGFEKRAKESARRAFELSSGLSPEDRLLIEARFRQSDGDWTTAREVYRELWQSFPDNLDYGLGLVSASTAAGDPRSALETIEQLRLLPAPLGEDARIDLAEAAAAALAAQVDRQEQAAVRAIAKAEADDAALPLARALLTRAQALRALGRLAESEQASTRAMELYARLDQPPGLAEATSALASARFDQSLYDQAAEGYLDAADIYRRLGARGGLASALNNLAVVRKRQGDFNRAAELYQETEQIYEEVGDRRGLAVARNNQAVLLVDRDRLDEAGSIFEASLDIWQQAGGDAGRAYALNNLAEVERLQGRLAASRERHIEALRIREQAGLKYDAAISHANLAGVYLALGELDAASAELDAAASLDQEIDGDHPTLASLIDFQRGELALWAGRLEEAWEHHQKALTTRQDAQLSALVPSSQIALARAALEDGRLLDAEELAGTARDVYQVDERPADELLASALLIRAYAASGQIDEASVLLDEASLLDAGVQQPATAIAFDIATAHLESAQGRSADALARLALVVEEAERASLVLPSLEARRAILEIAEAAGQDDDESRRALLAAAESGLELFAEP